MRFPPRNLCYIMHSYCLLQEVLHKIKHTRKSARRSTEVLEIIHTNICGPFDNPYFGGEKYFITFIDDLSRYGYVYLLHEKSQSVDALKVYITGIERQLDRKVKIIRSNRGGEYYGKYDESR